MEKGHFIWTEANPFSLEGNGTAILMLHGFSASPSELRLLADGLNWLGYSVRAPLLPGHGSDPRRLNSTRAEDWKDAVARELAQMRANSDRVVVIGLSMGGLLALWMVEEGLTSAETFVINPALEVRNPLSRLAGPIGKVCRFLPKKKDEESERLAAMGRFAYEVVPVKAFRELDRLRREVITGRDALTLHPPVCFQSRNDPAVVSSAVAGFWEDLPGAELIWLEESKHVATMGPEVGLIVTAIDERLRHVKGEDSRAADL
jgi:carboxylesterase